MDTRQFLDQMNEVLGMLVDAYENKDNMDSNTDELADLEAEQEFETEDNMDEATDNESTDDYSVEEVAAEVSNILYVYKAVEDAILDVVETLDEDATFSAVDAYISEDSKVNVVVEFTDSNGTTQEEYNF